MNRKNTKRIPQGERTSNRLQSEADAIEEITQLRSAHQHMQDFASQIPPLSPDQLHAIVTSNRIPQFQLRRQADSYLLAVSLAFLAVVASILWRTDSFGVSPLNITLLVIAIVDVWVALRATHSLWLLWQTHRLRHHPYRMAHYATQLKRLSHRRQRWLNFILKDNYNPVSDKGYRRQELFSLRLPSYSLAACLFLLIILNSDQAFATTRNYTKITTSTEKTETTIYDSVVNIISML